MKAANEAEPGAFSFTLPVTAQNSKQVTSCRNSKPSTHSLHDSNNAFDAISEKCTLLTSVQSRRQAETALNSYLPQASRAESQRLTSGPSVYFQAVSRPLELSLQSSLQLSLTVLVCYRSRGYI